MFIFTVTEYSQPDKIYNGFRNVKGNKFEKDTLIVITFTGDSIDIWECNDKVGVENLKQYYRDCSEEVTIKVLKQ